MLFYHKIYKLSKNGICYYYCHFIIIFNDNLQKMSNNSLSLTDQKERILAEYENIQIDDVHLHLL